MTSTSSGPCVPQFMHTDMSRSWAGRVSCGAAGAGATRQPRGLARRRGPAHTAPLTLGFCSHISSFCTAISRTSL